jgi:hypothetical protein
VKKLLALLLFSISLSAQTVHYIGRITGVGAPGGTCAIYIDYMDTSTVPGTLYTCPVDGGSYALANGGFATWGSITGTLSNQTDLQNALNLKANLSSNLSVFATGGNIAPAQVLATGIVDGVAPVTVTTGTTFNIGSTYNSGYYFNQEATAGTAVVGTLPATATGKQYCVFNSIVSGTGAPDTGTITVYPPASSYVILNGVINTIGGGGTHGVASSGAAADAACFVAIDSTHWNVNVLKGTWTAN